MTKIKYLAWFIFFLPMAGVLQAQNPLFNVQWRFGIQGGVDFNTVPPQNAQGAQLQTGEGSASLADPETGELLFYTDGSTLWNAQNQPMPNGTGLFGGATFSSTTAAVIVPRPFRQDQFYVITIDEQFGNKGIRYNIVDMSLDGGKGDVVSGQKNLFLFSTQSEKLEVVPGSDRCSLWLVTHDNPGNTFYSFKISNSGIDPNPVISTVGGNHGNGAGHMKVNRQFNRLALGNITAMQVELYDFDNTTGQVSNPRTWMFPGSDPNLYGLEFSPNGRFLYVSNLQKVVQFDVSLPTLAGIVGSTFNVSEGIFPYQPAALQLGPDNKIYIASGGLDFIANPDVAGNNCNLVSPGLQLTGGGGYGLPKRVEGLHSPVNKILALDSCQSDTIRFGLLSPGSGFESLEWSFGDPGSGNANTSSSLAPGHFFNTAGTYQIQVLLRYPCFTDTLRKSLNVFPCEPLDIKRDGDSCSLTQRFQVSGTLVSPSAIRWNFGDSLSGSSDSITVAPSVEAVTHVFSGPGTYEVCFRVRQNGGPEQQICRSFSFGNCCTGTILALDSCAFDSIRFVWKGKEAPTRVEWTFGDSLSGAANFQIRTEGRHLFSAPGSYRVKARAQLSCGIAEVVQVVRIVDCPFPCEAMIVLEDSCWQSQNRLRLQSLSPVRSVTWNFGDPNGTSPNFSEELAPERIFSRADSFEVTAFVGLDCGTQVLRKTVRIKDCGILCELKVPNLILPEGSPSNARLTLESDCGIRTASFRVFNRWGQSVFESKGPAPFWDGKDAVEGLYFYEIQAELENGSVLKKADWVWLKK